MTDISVALERNQNVCSHKAAFGNSEVIYPMSKKTISASNEQETVTGRHENRTEALPVSMCLNGVSSTVVLLPHNQEPNGKVTQHSVGLSLCKAPRDLQSSAAKLALFFFFFLLHTGSSRTPSPSVCLCGAKYTIDADLCVVL